MKLILTVVLITLFGLVGYGISSHYIARKKFFFTLANFLNKLKSDIGFSTKNLVDIIEDNIKQKCNSNFVTMLQNYKEVVFNRNTLNIDELFKNINILTSQEKDSIFTFFKDLGRVDVFNQNEIIDKFYIVVDEYLQGAKVESKKYSSLYTKLGIILGAFVALIIL